MSRQQRPEAPRPGPFESHRRYWKAVPVSAPAKHALLISPGSRLATDIAPRQDDRPASFERSTSDASCLAAVDRHRTASNGNLLSTDELR